jgi:hypothetical protein
MNPHTDAFKAMILREFFLEPRLAEEFQAARVVSWVGGKLAWPLSKVVAAKLGIPPKPVELAVRAITGERFTALPVRSFSDILAAFKSPDDNYRSACRSALCYSVTGSREWAFGALRVAASKHDDWARHHHLYGLIHGVFGDYDKALPELERARAAEPMEDVRARIGETVELCRAAPFSPAVGSAGGGLLERAVPMLPEVVRLLLELIGEAGRAESERSSSG